MFLGPPTVIYPAPDLPASRALYRRIVGSDASFDEPCCVGFSVGVGPA